MRGHFGLSPLFLTTSSLDFRVKASVWWQGMSELRLGLGQHQAYCVWGWAVRKNGNKWTSVKVLKKIE